MRFRVRVLKRAQRDLVEIRDYLARANPGAAERIRERLLDRLESLETFPTRGAVPRDERLRDAGYRFLVHGDYLIFYKVIGRAARVYRVLHGRRDYRRIL